MIRHRRAAAIFAFLVLPLIAGCGKQGALKPALAPDPASADRAAIESLAQSAPELDVSFTDDGGELLGEATAAAPTLGGQLAPAAAADSATIPIHWGRWRIPPGHPPTRTVEFITGPDADRALVKVNVKFDGLFFVDRTDDGILNPGHKPLKDQVTRFALFRKIWFHPDPASTDSVFGWRLIGVSPSEFTMIDPARQTVHLGSVTLTGERTHVTITDPSALLTLGRTSNLLPFFRSGENVKVEAAVTNSDMGFDPATFVFLHVPIGDHAFPGPRERVRIRMWDDGAHGDATAGDGVFTTIWTVQDLGIHHAAIDLINSRTLQNEHDDDYNSTAWGVPYVTYPSFLP
jgi:hypothetical protein